MYDQPGVDATTVVNNNGNFLQDLNAPGTVKEGLVGSYIQVRDSVKSGGKRVGLCRSNLSVVAVVTAYCDLPDARPAHPSLIKDALV